MPYNKSFTWEFIERRTESNDVPKFITASFGLILHSPNYCKTGSMLTLASCCLVQVIRNSALL